MAGNESALARCIVADGLVLVREVGDSCGYYETPIGNPMLESELSDERARRMDTRIGHNVCEYYHISKTNRDRAMVNIKHE